MELLGGVTGRRNQPRKGKGGRSKHSDRPSDQMSTFGGTRLQLEKCKTIFYYEMHSLLGDSTLVDNSKNIGKHSLPAFTAEMPLLHFYMHHGFGGKTCSSGLVIRGWPSRRSALSWLWEATGVYPCCVSCHTCSSLWFLGVGEFILQTPDPSLRQLIKRTPRFLQGFSLVDQI